MTVTVQSIIDKANRILNDEGNVTYTVPEKIGWINDAQLDIARIPGNNSFTGIMQLASGAKQQTPNDAIAMIDFIRNMGELGTTPGDIIRIVTMQAMDSISDWLSSTQANEVEHVVYEPAKNDGIFYVYPPNTGGRYIEVTYSKKPSQVGSLDNISVDDKFATAIIDYIAYRAYSKDTDASAAQRSTIHLERFLTAIAV